MARTSDPELQALHNQLDEAWTADVPNIAEIHRCRTRIFKHLIRCALGLTDADAKKGAGQPTLRVISNDAPDASTPRGICSPLKTDEIRQFEASARAVFGDMASCTTTWSDRSQQHP